MQLSCPACGARTSLAAHEVFLTCESCDARLVCHRGAGQRHLMLPVRVDPAGAAAALVEERVIPELESSL